MKVENSLISKMWGLILGSIFIACGLISIASLIISSNESKRYIRQRMLDIAGCVAASIDGDEFEMITGNAQFTPAYLSVCDRLYAFTNNAEFKRIYGVKVNDDGKYIFVVDSDKEHPALFGQEVYTTDALIAAAGGEASVTKKHYTDEWGTFYSAYCPIYDSEDNVAGIIGADFTVGWYEEQIGRQTKKSITIYLNILCIALISAGAICYLQVKSFTKPMEHITAVAKRYEKGDYSDNLEVERDDEIGVLSRSLQSMAESLTEQIKKAEDANRAKSDFLANMSHEIRTPINAVLGMNEMILRESEDEDILAYSENIRTAGNTLLGLINDILDFSKIESGKLEIIPVDYDLSSLINDLVNMIRARADDKGLELKLDINPDTPKFLHGDAVRIKQIITNILTNAVKYTEKGSVTLQISYEKPDDDPDSINIIAGVKDTGIGIKEEDMVKLFSEFERIEEKRNRNIEGTGLGMSITKRFLEMMDSNLMVESVYGEGSYFHFALKQEVVRWEKIEDYETAYNTYLSNNKKYKEKFTAPDADILVVDDNPMNLMVFKGLVKQTKVMIDTAASGDEGLSLSRNKKYDIIFLDHMMPKKDGIETLHELKSQVDNPNLNTPFVCLTANAISGAKEQYISEGFDDYLTKPIDSSKLEDMIIRYLPKDKICMDIKEEVPDSIDVDLPYDNPESGYSLALKALKECEYIDVDTGINNSGDADSYMSLVKIFYDTLSDKTDELTGFLENDDIKNYTIKVHALKSSLKIIGATEVGELAQELENAGKADDRNYIDEHNESFIGKCMRIKDALKDIFDADVDDSDKVLADYSLMSRIYADIKTAADEMDCDRLEEILADMESYAIPEAEAERFLKIRKCIDNFDYEGVLSALE